MHFSVDVCKHGVYNLFSNSPGGETYISLWGSPEIYINISHITIHII